jgi:4-amino-4-deoxy-L-arabinose transferase-like glycosyltransferase
MAVALALLVAAIGTRTFGPRAGWLAACALGSTIGLPLAARVDGGQLLATLCAWYGIGALLRVLQGRTWHRDATRLLAWLALGGALLTGGPLSALWPLGGFALYFALARPRRPWREVRPLAGLLIVLGLALPWYGLMTALYGGDFLAHVPWFPYALDRRASWLAAPLLALSYPLLLGFPWAPVLGASLRDAAQRLRRPAPGGPHDLRDGGHVATLLLALLIAACVPVALYPHAPLTAALPALPAIALLCGRFLDRVLDGDVDARLLGGAARWSAVLGTLVALFGAALAGRIPAAAAALRLASTVVFLASWLPVLADLAGRRRLAAALFALPVALGAPLVCARVLPALEPWLNTREVAEDVLAVAPASAPLVLLEPPPPSLRLLLPRNFVPLRHWPAGLDALAASDGEAYVAFPPAREHEVARTAPAPLEIMARTPTLVLARIALAPPARMPERVPGR